MCCENILIFLLHWAFGYFFSAQRQHTGNFWISDLLQNCGTNITVLNSINVAKGEACSIASSNLLWPQHWRWILFFPGRLWKQIHGSGPWNSQNLIPRIKPSCFIDFALQRIIGLRLLLAILSALINNKWDYPKRMGSPGNLQEHLNRLLERVNHQSISPN